MTKEIILVPENDSFDSEQLMAALRDVLSDHFIALGDERLAEIESDTEFMLSALDDPVDATGYLMTHLVDLYYEAHGWGDDIKPELGDGSGEGKSRHDEAADWAEKILVEYGVLEQEM
jgi:hypothetical protein